MALPVNLDESPYLAGSTDLRDAIARAEPARFGANRAYHFPSFDIEKFENLLWRREGNLVRDLEVEGISGTIAVPRRPGGKDLFRWAIDRYYDGCALRMSQIEISDPQIAALLSTVGQDLLASVTIEGLLLSYSSWATTVPQDAEEHLLVFQAVGQSHWHFDAGQAPKKTSFHVGDAALTTSTLLYIPPRRTAGSVVSETAPQATSTSAEESLCLVLRIRPHSFCDLIECLVEAASEAMPGLRRTVPNEPGALAREYSHVLAQLGDHVMEDPQVLARAWERMRLRIADSHRALPGGMLATRKALDCIGETTLVTVRSGAFFATSSNEEGISLYVAGLAGVSARISEPGGVLLPNVAKGMIEDIAVRVGPFNARELSDRYSIVARLAVVRRLVREGALRLVQHDAARARLSA